jgi:protein phosphatase
MRYSLDSDPGRRYELNEDVVVFDAEAGVWLVADGMGGHPAGEVASAIAARKVLELAGPEGDLVTAITAAHREIVAVAAQSPDRDGMGTTIVVVRIRGVDATIAWVGDSRAYLWRNGQLRQMTKDHSFMQLLIEGKRITPEEARRHPQRNVVTQVLGVGDPRPDQMTFELRPGDLLLLCTDGLNDELTDTEIAGQLENQADFDGVARALVRSACEAGGRDNVTACVLDPELAASTTVVRGAGVEVGEKRVAAWIAVGVVIAVIVSIVLLSGG